MIGVFDSGIGGARTAEVLHRLLPREDILLLQDRKQAPYGTKTPDELRRIVNFNIRKLINMGADRILIGCCTAGSVFGDIPIGLRRRTTEIITPTAKAALDSNPRRVTVIATEATVRSRAFTLALREGINESDVSEIEAQELVRFTEDGDRDGALRDETAVYLNRLCERLSALSPDTLILGCTHFPYLSNEIGARLPGVKIISSADEGARHMATTVKESTGEGGRLVYLN